MSESRRLRVLRFLQEHAGEWIDGPRIASPEIGGSEGLKRVRELRQEGWDIRLRRHPDPRRDCYQYRLVPGQRPRDLPDLPGDFPLVRRPDGTVEVMWITCPDCGGRYVDEAAHQESLEHLRALSVAETIESRTEIPELPDRPEWAFKKLPKQIDFGSVVVCPRCKGFRRPPKRQVIDGRAVYSGGDEYCMDPQNRKVLCTRCNGFGIVPNRGPIA